MWRIFPYDRLSSGEVSQHDKLSVGRCLHIVNKEKIMSCGEMWSKICHVETFFHKINVEKNNFLLLFMLFFLEICFVSIYAVLPRNIFCRDLRAFVWRKIIEKLCLWRKKDEYEVWSYENTKNKRNYFYNLSVILKLRLNVTIILFFI